jgi:hypothetical protein
VLSCSVHHTKVRNIYDMMFVCRCMKPSDEECSAVVCITHVAGACSDMTFVKVADAGVA